MHIPGKICAHVERVLVRHGGWLAVELGTLESGGDWENPVVMFCHDGSTVAVMEEDIVAFVTSVKLNFPD
jgi:hypothetical protein